MYKDAQLSLNDSQLTLNSIAVAVDHLQSLEFLSFNASQNIQLRKDIDNAYLSLSEYQFSINENQQAQETIRAGLQINSKNIKLSNLLEKINLLQQEKDKAIAATIESKKPEPIKDEPSLPIFGTF